MVIWLLVVVGILILLTLLAIAAIGQIRLQSPVGLAGDGRLPGTIAPVWSADDTDGLQRASPALGQWQVLVFTDHSIHGFPRAIRDLSDLSRSNESPQILVLSRTWTDMTKVVLDEAGLAIPVVPVTSKTYHAYNARVMPFATVIDPDGLIRRSGLISGRHDLPTLLSTARADLGELKDYAGRVRNGRSK